LNLKTAEREVFALWDGVAAWAGPPGTRWWGRSRAIAGPLQSRSPTPIPGMSQGHFKGNSRTFQGYFKDNPSLFQGYSKDFPSIFQGHFKDVSRMFQECCKDVVSILEPPHPFLSRPAPRPDIHSPPPLVWRNRRSGPQVSWLNIHTSEDLSSRDLTDSTWIPQVNLTQRRSAAEPQPKKRIEDGGLRMEGAASRRQLKTKN